jgi:hypothetical protein
VSTPAPQTEPPRHGITGALTTIGEGLLKVLPPAFLLLIILNVIFIGIVAWVSDRNAEQRNLMLTKIVEKCLLEPRAR